MNTEKKPRKKHEHKERDASRQYMKRQPCPFKVREFFSIFDLWPVK